MSAVTPSTPPNAQLGYIGARAIPDHRTLLTVALTLLSERVVRYGTLAMASGLFIFTIAQPSWERLWPRLVTACAFTVLVHFPMWYRRERKEPSDAAQG